MAVYPCAVDQHRYPGPQRSLYITAANGARPETRKVRLCKRHFDDLYERVPTWFSLLETDTPASPECQVCGQPRHWVIFLRFFDQGEEPTQWAGDLCAAHTRVALGQLGWDGAQALS